MIVAKCKYLMAGAENPCASDIWEGEAEKYCCLLDMSLHSDSYQAR